MPRWHRVEAPATRPVEGQMERSTHAALRRSCGLQASRSSAGVKPGEDETDMHTCKGLTTEAKLLN